MNELVLLPAGVIAGIVNAVAGGGSLLTFPVFLAIGFPPLQANVTNAVGIFASNIGAVWGYRRELIPLRHRTAALCAAGAGGSLAGAILLLSAGEAAFEAVVPWLILLGALLVLGQPVITKRVKLAARSTHNHFRVVVLLTAIVAIYGGYFGAAMGVMFLGVMGLLVREPLQQLNAYKNAVAMCVNFTCAAIFAIFADVDWSAAALMTVGTVTGGLIGAKVARSLPDTQLRIAVVGIGVFAAIAVGLR